jgi:uncharacterized protein DUF1799
LGARSADPRLSERHKRGRAGKLRAAARAWAAGTLFESGPTIGELAEDARAWGIDPAVFNKSEATGRLEIWWQHREAVLAFCAAASQWRTGVVGREGRISTLILGLDYAGARAGWELKGLTITPAVFAAVVVMEQAARTALNGE